MPPAHNIVETDDGSFDSAANDITPDQLLSLYYEETATTTPGLAMATIGNGPHTTPSTTFVPLTTTTSSSTTTTTPTPSTTTQQPSIISTTAVPSVSASQAASESGTTHKGTSSAAIGVIVTLLILALGGAAFFLVRRKHIRDRQRRRATWNQSSFTQEVPPAGSKDLEDNGDKFDIVDIDEKGATPLPDHVTYNTLTMPNYTMPAPPKPLHAAALAPPRMPSPPPVIVTSSDNPQLITATPFGAVKAAHASMASSTSSAMNAQVMTGHLVVVARTFVPTLPDELSIQTGEQVRVINRFDDGWAHVERTRSGAGAENGVVPVECLETLPLFTLESATASIASGGTNAGLTQEAVEGWRLSKRKSSLVPAGSLPHY